MRDKFIDLIAFYENKLQKYEEGHKVLNWGSKDSQITRFNILSKINDLNGCSVLDVGCGIGDFYLWLKNKNIEVEYYGIDISAKMIKKASTKYPEVFFKLCDLFIDHEKLINTDYVFASGIFNRKIEQHDEFVKRMIEIMFQKSNYGIGFNILSNRARFKENNSYYADAQSMFYFCETVANRVVMNHDYMEHDVTYFLYK